METKNNGLYIHIPFCVSKCTYCDFASVAKNSTLIDEYTLSLCTEMKMRKSEFSQITFDTIFIGGGTPSCIPKSNLERIISSIYQNFNTDINEFTVEINPGTGDAGMFEMMKNLGVNRASIGLQCANDNVLKSIGRIHNIEQFKNTINEIKYAGIGNFSVDIITGLPKQSTYDLVASVDLAYELGANHISMYMLKLEDGTPLKMAVDSGKTVLPTSDEEYQMSLSAKKHLISLGYNRYEISNYAKAGCESKHNLKYWNRTPYLGLGVAAASMYAGTRSVNTNSIQTYISNVTTGELPLADKTKLTHEEEAFEMIMLSTRLSIGMEYAEYNEYTNSDFKFKYANILDELYEKKLIKKSNTHLILSQKGMDLQNSVLLKFMD